MAKKKLSAAHIRKLVEGRKRYISRQYGIIYRVTDDLIICLANGNYVVQDGRHKSCCQSLEAAILEVQRILEIRNMLASEQKGLSDIVRAITVAHEATKLLIQDLAGKIKDR